MKRVLFVVLFSLSFVSLAAEQSFEFEDEAQRALFLQLTKELRCPMCQNQNIADSDALVAKDLRRKTYELVKQGNDRSQVIDFMKQRYGDFVYYKPPVTPVTLWLWILPLLFVVVAAVYIFNKKRIPEIIDEEAKLAKAEKMLEQEQ